MKSTLAVLLLGIAIGILIAPEKGSITRQKISDLIDDLSEAGHHLTKKVPDSPKMSTDLS